MNDTINTPARTFRDLIMWKRAHQLVLSIYSYTEGFPKKEMHGLTAQLRRAAISVPANISEGFIKRGVRDKARFFNIAQGSLQGSTYYRILAQDLEYGDSSSLQQHAEEISKIINSYYSNMLRHVSF